jgi:nicotinate-nucleotide--dimethylbenzimidazole phosphoribosyltransferase
MDSELKQYLNNLKPLSQTAMVEAKRHWDSIAKPLESLGVFEDMVIQMAGIFGKDSVRLDKKAIVVMCSDNGVVVEGVTQTDSTVTAIVTENFAKGIASVNHMAGAAGAKVIPVDIGVNRDIQHPNLINKKVAYGTKNMANEPAMTREQALQAIIAGIDVVKSLKEDGYEIIGTGEMGIGNTSTSSAIASILLDLPVEMVTGKGAGLPSEGVLRKIQVIKKAIHNNQPDSTDPIDVLAKVGGFDIAGMTGLFLGGAIHGIPVVIDGFISSISALIAARLSKTAISYMLPSHLSKEPASMLIMKELGITPVIHGGLALGEGTGTALLFSMLDLILKVYQFNSTFDDIQVEAYKKF